MLKILQARLQQYVKNELPDVQAGFRKGRGTRGQIANICWIIKKSKKSSRNTSTSALLTMPKSLIVWIRTKCGKFLKRIFPGDLGMPDHLTCLLRNWYAGQEATVRTGHGTTDWFQIGKGVCQVCILSPCLFNLYEEHIMIMSGWMKHKLESRFPGEISITKEPFDESEKGGKVGLKLNIQKTKIMASSPITSWHLVPSLHGK